MNQQFIIDMAGRFPFGEIEQEGSSLPGISCYVRKFLPYFTQADYLKIKSKLNFAKELTHINLVPLVKVLEESGRFHLLYQYAPHSVMDKNGPLHHSLSIDSIRIKLIYLSVYLIQKGIHANFDLENLGFNHQNQLQYFMGPEFQTLPRPQSYLYSHYMQEVNVLCENLQQTLALAQAQETQKNTTKLSRIIRKSSIQRHNKINSFVSGALQEDSRTYISSTYKSHASKKSSNSPKEHTIRMLNNIQRRLQELKISLVHRSMSKDQSNKSLRYNPIGIKHHTKTLPNQNNQPPLKQGASQKIIRPLRFQNNRKYSGDVMHFSPLMKKMNEAETAKSVRQKHNKPLRKISEATNEYRFTRKQSEYIPASVHGVQKTLSSSREMSEYSLFGTKDMKKTQKQNQYLDELKKKEFLTMSRSKGNYIDEFLQILGDEDAPKNTVTTINSFSELEKVDYQKPHPLQEGAGSSGVVGSDSSFSPKNSNHQSSSEHITKYIQPSKLSEQRLPTTPHKDRNSMNSSQNNNLIQKYNNEETRSNTHTAKYSFLKKNSKEDNNKKQKQVQLRERISKAIKKSDEALSRYRKLSMHSVTESFESGKNSHN